MGSNIRERDIREIFKRHPNNPILRREDMGGWVNSVFNPAATWFEGKVLLMLRVEDKTGISHLATATSQDGVSSWEIMDPSMLHDPDRPEEEYGLEDARITYLEEIGSWGITYTAYSRLGPLVSLATTKDFKGFRRLGPIFPPENKDAGLFPERIKGKWAMIHRPVTCSTPPKGHMWISYSPDLIHWGEHSCLLSPREGAWWDSEKIGLGPPPLKTDLGWLLLYHGTKRTVNGSIYRLGLALLDKEEPSKVLFRSKAWVFGPTESYERLGDVGNVTFPCGWILNRDQIWIYYGAADSSVCLATASISDVLSFIKEEMGE